MQNRSLLFFLIFLLLLAGSCSSDTPFHERSGLIPKLTAWLKGWLEKERPPTPPTHENVDPTQATFLRKHRMQGELLKEMYVVVLQKEPKDFDEFSALRDALMQGATLEGIYNGFTHSAHFRKLETLNRGSALETARIFAEELEYLEMELPVRTRFTEKSARPLEKFLRPDLLPLAQNGVNSEPELTPFDLLQGGQAIGYYTKVFYMASMYTLKRVLGDEAMRLVDFKRVDREELAGWYGKWAARLATRKTDFGLTLRNKADESFHQHWALTASEDLLRWEVLNRLHRLINESHGRK